VKKVIAIQARMSSRRLPGKSMRSLVGKPMIQYTVERLLSLTRDSDLQLLIATSADATDDQIEIFCQQQKIQCFRGPLENVALRFLNAAVANDAEVIVRINGDSPVLDIALVQQALVIFARNSVDLVTNVFPRTFPKGQSVEIFTLEALERAYCAMQNEEKEHVTQYFYNHSDKFQIENFASVDSSHAEIQLSIDSYDDFLLLEKMITRMDKPHECYSYLELVELREMVLAEEKL
jgi:spore coat polysaccharide biosynthesis protein SpsF